MRPARISVILAFGALAALGAPRTETVDFSPRGAIRIDRADGYLSIEAWDEPKVEITTNTTAKERIETTRPSTGELVIRTELPHHTNFAKRARHVGIHADADYVIRVPRNSRLAVTHANGYVGITGVAGDSVLPRRISRNGRSTRGRKSALRRRIRMAG
ncbi:MAG TPA: hypothetical protein VHC72_22190 [Bryobacteraceae bacterium]|nr:hypothetical protein [Bryobacteraceae bacterium]